MSWNEPGGDQKDPWSGRNDQKKPPDLDEAIRSIQEKLSGLFSGGGGGGGGGGGNSASTLKGLGFFALAALVMWLLSGFYIVDEGNRGVELQFGKYSETTNPGLHWHYPVPIVTVSNVNVEQQRFLELGYRSGGSQQALGSVLKESLMLTKDENIVDIRLAIQYQVKDAKHFLFNVLSPASTLKDITESSIRGVIGQNTMDFALTEGRTEIVSETKGEIQDIMDYYEAGIRITSVNLQDAQPPEEVQSAFEDAIKAREDKQRLINEAQGYYNDVIPKARGAGARKLQEAEGYKASVIARSEGEASRFTSLLTEYSKAPKITRERIYLESMEQVLNSTETVMIDLKSGNNLIYLPLDKLKSNSKSTKQSSRNSDIEIPITPAQMAQKISNSSRRNSGRGRGERGR